MLIHFHIDLEVNMHKQFLTVVLWVASTVSCVPASRPELLSNTTTLIAPTKVSILTPSSTAKSMPTLASLHTLSTPGDEPILVFFVSEQGKFEIWMPISESIIEHTGTQMLFKKSVECSIIFSRLNGAGAIVQYCDLAPEDIASLSANAVLEEARDTLKKDFHLRIAEEQKEVLTGSYPALKVSGEEDMRGLGYDGTFKARIIFVENRIYFVLMSVHSDNWCNCLHQIDQVVDSFYIDPALSIPFEPTP
jgi:hypothetical protein